MKDDDDADRRQLVVVVLVLKTLRVAVVSDVAFQRYLLTPSHVTVITYSNKKLSYRRETARRSVSLANSLHDT